MPTFQWSSDFETGLPVVDQQHHRLVDIINKFAEYASEGSARPERIQPVLDELLDYAGYHFEEEEKKMEACSLDTRHIEDHRLKHIDFIKEVDNLRSGLAFDRSEDIQRLLDFLIHWLAFHILGTDQNMARQIESLDQGLSASEAYVKQEIAGKQSVEPMTIALNHLFKLVSARNRDLMNLNETLEARVQKRTRELLAANRRLEQLALTDELTGLFNRRYAMQVLKVLWGNERRRDQNLCCMMIDADYFKEVNDRFGHDAGDEVLIRLAETLKDNLRTDDILCRMGGDEFLVVCSETDLQGGLHLAENLLREVNGLSLNLAGGVWNGQASIGVAARTDEMSTWNDLIKGADQAVYRAKNSGRNCVRS